MFRRPACAAAAIFLSLAASTRPLAAQHGYGRTDLPTVLVGNAVIGGLTAGVHAAIRGDHIGKALLVGTLGGAVHGVGKSYGRDFGLAGVQLGAVGTSIVANAGRGESPLSSLMLPLGPARIRVTPYAPRKVHFALNAYESAYLVKGFLQPGWRLDWDQSHQSGTFAFRASSDLYSARGKRAVGLTSGSMITVSDIAAQPEETFAHERVHVQQNWFAHEVWGRPIETAVRERVSFLKWIPGWIEIGAVSPAILVLEAQAFGLNGPLRSWRESEAETLENWRR